MTERFMVAFTAQEMRRHRVVMSLERKALLKRMRREAMENCDYHTVSMIDREYHGNNEFTWGKYE